MGHRLGLTTDVDRTSLHGTVPGLFESGSAKTRTDEVDLNPVGSPVEVQWTVWLKSSGQSD